MSESGSSKRFMELVADGKVAVADLIRWQKMEQRMIKLMAGKRKANGELYSGDQNRYNLCFNELTKIEEKYANGFDLSKDIIHRQVRTR